MKRFLSFSIALSIISHIVSPLIVLGVEEKRTFIVTAYYSPLPNQSFYLRGNYEDEIILNGEGTHGASGKRVFPGMLAAPKNYPFGTKIELEGIGLGSVEDRGGAIVNAGKRGYEHDRIDVWMGYGEEGLRKALNWGKRKVDGTVYGKINKSTSVDINNFKQANIGTGVEKKMSFDIFSNGVGKESNEEDIKKLQKFLNEIGLYQGSIDGIYNLELINTIYSFQKKYEIISSPEEVGAGYWGIKTRKKIQELYKSGFFSKEDTKAQNEEFDIFKTAMGQESPKEHILKLQKLFTELQYYDGEISGNYSDIISVLIDYQIENGIIFDASDKAAGYFGPKTREQAKRDYDSFLEKKKQEEEFIKRMEHIRLIALSESQKIIDEVKDIKKGETSLAVRSFQNLLKKLGYFEHNDTAIFGDKTEEAIFLYQKDKKLVEKIGDPGAGKLGPKTLEALKNDLTNKLIEEKVKTSTK